MQPFSHPSIRKMPPVLYLCCICELDPVLYRQLTLVIEDVYCCAAFTTLS